MRYFFFGTLRDLDVLKIVLDRTVGDLVIRPAHLNGYRTRLAIAEPYPVLESSPDHSVEGVTVEGITSADVERILFFEESEYGNESVDVEMDDGRSVSALVHTSSHFEYYRDIDWDYATWCQTDKPILLVLAQQWMKHLDSEDLDAADKEWDRTRERLQGGEKTLRRAV